MKFIPCLKQLKPNGKIVYEYNPFRNYRDDAGKIGDLITSKLNFDLEHPVQIECQHSYDGSVNLILNDGLNPIRLINSRFSTRENNTYEIVDRTGSADTNLYDDSQFDIDTSLYKKINTIPKIQFLGLTYGGNLPVGNYNFYFKYSDADDNETDFIGESSNVVCHIGNLNDPKSIRSGIENENSGKTIKFDISNLDSGYDYIKVYYTRQTSGLHGQPNVEAKVLIKKFKCKGNACTINITGFEETLDISLEEINKEYFLAETAKSTAQCKNRLFLANLTKPHIDYQDFSDISLRMTPWYDVDTPNLLSNNYKTAGDYLYYDVKNIYDKVGYWENEIYRLGVVYILSDNSLSPVFNIRGGELGSTDFTQHNQQFENNTQPEDYDFLFEYDGNNKTSKRRYIEYDETTGLIAENTVTLENAKGVIRIKQNAVDNTKRYRLQIKIHESVKNYLKETLKVKGFFFVRQKRNPTLLTQAYVIGHDIVSGIPMIPLGGEYRFESFVSDTGLLTNQYKQRLRSLTNYYCNNEIAICPDYSLRQEIYNNFFTDTEYVVQEESNKWTLVEDSLNDRHYHTTREDCDTAYTRTISIIGVPDSTVAKRTKTSIFCSKAGNVESLEFKTVGEEFELDYKNSNVKNNIVRGNFGPFLGLSDYRGDHSRIVNIYIPKYSETQMPDYFQIRMEDQSPYYAITDRLDINNVTSLIDNIYRGDCYICQYTHRLNRNFADLNAPTADKIVDASCWVSNYTPETAPEKMADINIGDLNAVQLGNWITFTVKSSMNLSIRDEDSSYVSESLLMGNNRSFYPLTEMSVDGNYKIPESSVINTGISAQNSQRVNFAQDAVPYIKNNFQTRIAYSDIAITDAYKNGYRTFQAMSYQDYPTTYGGIMKILEVNDQLLVIFEHGIGLLPVNERVVAGNGLGGNVFINANKVLPETINIISSDIGSQWPDSVIKGAAGVYGIDTVAKKIWRYSGNGLEMLSDFTVQKFLNDNISLTERELTPFIGVRNVKTHYNAFKQDIMFTFYDNKDKYEEVVWNLCYNERTGKFTTFYSWLPSFSANIDNIFFTFDRDTSKKLGKLAHTLKDGIVANTVFLDKAIDDEDFNTIYYNIYTKQEAEEKNLTFQPNCRFDTNSKCFILSNEDPTHMAVAQDEGDQFIKNGVFKVRNNQNESEEIILSINKNELPANLAKIEFIVEDTLFNMHKFFDYKPNYTNILIWQDDENDTLENHLEEHKIIPLNVKAIVYEQTNLSTPVEWKTFRKQLYFTKRKYVTVPSNKKLADSKLTTAFWKHGQSGIIDIKETIKPCNWYGKEHPFEFEFVVNASDPSTQKTFDTMQILSNNVPPESLHYTIIGDTYDFSEDKPNMYVRQEATKHAYHKNGSDITYDKNYTSITTAKSQKSTLFPTYYTRQDKIDEIYDSYIKSTHSEIKGGVDYCHLSGAEIIHDAGLNQFSIVNHQPAIDMKNHILGRLRGNMQYVDNTWRVQINPINLVQKNEKNWTNPPINIYYPQMIHDIFRVDTNIKPDDFTYDNDTWGEMKSIKLKDRYMKCRIRYKGNKLALITGVRTKYRV